MSHIIVYELYYSTLGRIPYNRISINYFCDSFLGHLHFIFCRFLPKRDIPVGQLYCVIKFLSDNDVILSSEFVTHLKTTLIMQICFPLWLVEQLALMFASVKDVVGSVGSQP